MSCPYSEIIFYSFLYYQSLWSHQMLPLHFDERPTVYRIPLTLKTADDEVRSKRHLICAAWDISRNSIYHLLTMNNRIITFLLFHGLVFLLQHVWQKLPVETIDSYPCNVPPLCTLPWSFLIRRHRCFIFMHLLG